MKTLLLLRHGKSDWNAGVDDVDRPLTKRGVRAAQAIGEFLTSAGQAPDAVVTSRARRATDTASRAAAAGRWLCELRENNKLYGGDTSDVLEAVRTQANTTRRLLLVGHEPTSSETIACLVGGGAYRLPTAAVAAVGLDVEQWADVEPGGGLLLYLVPPRLLTASMNGGDRP